MLFISSGKTDRRIGGKKERELPGLFHLLMTGHKERNIFASNSSSCERFGGCVGRVNQPFRKGFHPEAHVTLPTYLLLRCIICHSETWCVPEHW